MTACSTIARKRDVEIAVFDERGIMNGWCLPAGLAVVARLAEVDAVVQNGNAVSPAPTLVAPYSRCACWAGTFTVSTTRGCGPADLAGRKLHAVAGIGAPQRFFGHLHEMGLVFAGHSFADHHDYCAGDLVFAGDAILTTEKDAVKLSRLSLSLPVWVLPVTADVSPDLAAFVLEKLNGHPSA